MIEQNPLESFSQTSENTTVRYYSRVIGSTEKTVRESIKN